MRETQYESQKEELYLLISKHDTTPIFIYHLLLNFAIVLMRMGAMKINLLF